ncbi:MAG: LysR family transcriptional regulator [Gemmobacter sp.]|nr:LysR family transcriptional regulator [Gemmobacter sp.]
MLSELEQSLGLLLFERGRRGMIATVYGAALIRHAHLIISDVDAMREELAGLAAGASGRLSIGMITAAAAGPLSIAIARLKDRRPRLDITITVDTSDVLIPLLEQGRLDVVFGRPVSSDHAQDIVFTQIGPERLSIVCGAQNPLRLRQDLTLSGPATPPDPGNPGQARCVRWSRHRSAMPAWKPRPIWWKPPRSLRQPRCCSTAT